MQFSEDCVHYGDFMWKMEIFPYGHFPLFSLNHFPHQRQNYYRKIFPQFSGMRFWECEWHPPEKGASGELVLGHKSCDSLIGNSICELTRNEME